MGDWICWQPIWAPNFEPPSSTPTTYCGTCIGGAYGFRVREGSDLALSSKEFDTTIDLAGQDGTEEHTLELCLFKADQVPGPAPMPGATSTRYNSVKLHIVHEPPSAPPSPHPPAAPNHLPASDGGVCWDHYEQMKADGYDSFSGGDINIKCRNFAGSTCHNPDSEHFGCNSASGGWGTTASAPAAVATRRSRAADDEAGATAAGYAGLSDLQCWWIHRVPAFKAIGILNNIDELQRVEQLRNGLHGVVPPVLPGSGGCCPSPPSPPSPPAEPSPRHHPRLHVRLAWTMACLEQRGRRAHHQQWKPARLTRARTRASRTYDTIMGTNCRATCGYCPAGPPASPPSPGQPMPCTELGEFAIQDAGGGLRGRLGEDTCEQSYKIRNDGSYSGATGGPTRSTDVCHAWCARVSCPPPSAPPRPPPSPPPPIAAAT